MWRCSRAEVAPVPCARGLQRGPEGVGLAGRVAQADERQKEHDAGQDRQGRSAAAGRAEAELLQRYRQRQGDTCSQRCISSQYPLLTHAATPLIRQALHVACCAGGLYHPRLGPESVLAQPLSWGRPRMVRGHLYRHAQRSAPARRQPCSRWWIGHLAKGSIICCCAPSCKLSVSLRS